MESRDSGSGGFILDVEAVGMIKSGDEVRGWSVNGLNEKSVEICLGVGELGSDS